MITSQHHLIWISVRTPLHTFPWYTFNKLQEQIKGLEMKLNCWVESQALGRVQVAHTKVPQAQQIPEAEFRFPSSRRGPNQKIPDIFVFAT